MSAGEAEIIALQLYGEPGSFTELVPVYKQETWKPAPSLEQRETRGMTIGGRRVALRPGGWDPRKWWDFYAHSAVNASCVNAKARDIVGGGFTITSPTASEPLLDEMRRCCKRSLSSFTDACRDNEATGWAGLEVLPDLSGQHIYRFNHIDSWTLWPVLDEHYYVHRRNDKAVLYSDETLREPGTYQLLWMNNLHWWENTYYGVPDSVSVTIQIDSIWEALLFNREFFRRRGGYRWLLLLNDQPGSTAMGFGTSDAQIIKEINYAITKSGRASSADMLTVPLGTRTAMLHKLDADAKDLDFPTLLKAFRDDILMAHNVPPLKAGIVETGALGGNIGQQQLEAYRDNVVAPKQRLWNEAISRMLGAWYGVEVDFHFNEIEIDQFAALAYPISNLFQNQIIFRAEARQRLGLSDVDEGEPVWFNELLPPVESFPPETLQTITPAQPARPEDTNAPPSQ